MAYITQLKEPKNITINFSPSPKQYELWKYLQPDYCPHCGGKIVQVEAGINREGKMMYKPACGTCHTTELPQLILGGGAAGGGKSFVGSCWLISSCMRFSDIRAVVARKTLKSLKESTFNTIRKICRDWGLVENEHYKINNVEGTLTFWNNSTIIMKEMQDTPSDPNFERFGSSEYTIAFVDEVSEISERAVEVLFSRLRWRTAETFKTPRMLLTTNPCVNWVRSRFVQDDDGVPVVTAESEKYVPFSVFDNPDEAFVRAYAASLNKISDPTVKERLLYGNWNYVETNERAAYWRFDGDEHLVTNLREKAYNPLNPVIISFDFNVSPYMGSLAIQFDYSRKRIYVLEEIIGKPEEKENNTPALARKIGQKLLNDKHVGGVFVTGDPSGLSRSTQTEDGVNNYTIILNNMNHPVLKPQRRLLKKQPPQTTRLEFVNDIFAGYDGWKLEIDMRCRKLIEDLVYQRKNPDGTKNKAKATDHKTGGRYEKYGHLSDCLDYALCMFLASSWKKYQSSAGYSSITTVPTGDSTIYQFFGY